MIVKWMIYALKSVNKYKSLLLSRIWQRQDSSWMADINQPRFRSNREMGDWGSCDTKELTVRWRHECISYSHEILATVMTGWHVRTSRAVTQRVLVTQFVEYE